MTSIADRYISKSGRTADYDRSAFTDDLMTAGLFLVWAEEEYFGGQTGKEAFNAMCRMLDIDPIGLRKALNQ
jgi:hypothetical protein